MNLKVKFNDVDEFIAELEKTKPLDGILRLTRLAEQSATMPIRHLSVMATFLKDTPPTVQIIELRRYCGQVWGHASRSDEVVIERAKETMDKIEDAVAAMNFRGQRIEIRAGQFDWKEGEK